MTTPNIRAASLQQLSAPNPPAPDEPPTDEQLLESAAKALGYKSIPSDETCLTAEASELLDFARAVLARWGTPATLPAPLTDLAARLISESKPMDPEIAEALTPEARWDLYEGPATPPVPEPGEVGELATLFTVGSSCGGGARLSQDQCRRAATLLQQLSAPAPAVVPVAVAERLRIAKRGIVAGYNLGHHHTVEGCWGDPDEVADDYAEEALQDLGDEPAPAVVPVAVSERPWEKGGWTDLDGECWWCPPDGPAYWSMANPAMVYGGWLLPAHALPVPQAGEVEVPNA
jgi:hypothetical protein